MISSNMRVPHMRVPHMRVPHMRVPHMRVPHMRVAHMGVAHMGVAHMGVAHMGVGGHLENSRSFWCVWCVCRWKGHTGLAQNFRPSMLRVVLQKTSRWYASISHPLTNPHTYTRAHTHAHANLHARCGAREGPQGGRKRWHVGVWACGVVGTV